MGYKAKFVSSALERKGFIRDESRNHIFFIFYHNGKKTSIYTKTSHNNQEINDSLLSLMAKQVRLSKNDFCKMVDCHISKEEYTEKLLSRGDIHNKN